MWAIIKPRLSTVENPISFFIDPPRVLIYFQDHLTVDIKMVQRAMRDIIYISSSVSTSTAHFEFICLLATVFNCFRRFQALNLTDVAFIAVGGACGGDVEPPCVDILSLHSNESHFLCYC